MTQTLKTTERLGVVDALRGFALLAIVLLHNLEHYNLFFMPENVPAWLQTIDKYAWDTIFFLFAGNIIRKSKFPPNPERSVQFSGKRTKRSVQKKGCTQHL